MAMNVIERGAAAIAAAIVLAGCAGVESREGTQPRPDSTAGAAQGGRNASTDLAPNFRVETFDGETFRLSDHRGTPVVLNFWESW